MPGGEAAAAAHSAGAAEVAAAAPRHSAVAMHSAVALPALLHKGESLLTQRSAPESGSFLRSGADFLKPFLLGAEADEGRGRLTRALETAVS